jgi:broad specificity phosphatase PhoE
MTHPVGDPPVEDPHRVWLVRHGETEWARTGRHTGLTDIPLTATGVRQAIALRGSLDDRAFGLVLSSPASRALETARLAGFADRVVVDDDLHEWDYGAYEGRTSAEIERERPGWSIWRDGVEGGELIDAVAARADRVIARVRAAEAGDTLCFAHGHLLRILGARWIGLDPAGGARLALGTATISILGWERETPVIDRWNEAIELN